MWQIINVFLCGFISMLEVIYLGKIITKKFSITKRKLLIMGAVISIIYGIISLYFTGMPKTGLIFIINIFLYKLILKISIKKAIYLTFIYLVVLIVSDLLTLIVITKILGMSLEFCYETFAGSLMGNISILILFCIIIYILRKIIRKLFEIELENNNKLIYFLTATLICVLLFFYAIVKRFRFSNNIIICLSSIIVLLTVLFSLIKQTIQNNNLIKEYDKLLEIMTTFENEIEKQRILRHEIKNEFRTIRAKICDQQENKEIIEYIDEIVNDKYEIKKEKYAKFGYLPPNGIKGLCYFKVQEAEDKGITVSINISKRIKNSTIYNLTIKEQRDFGRILGVILDNAIEASLESKEKQIGIEAYSNSEKEFRLIVTNTYQNNIDKNKIGLEKFSTKGKTRGHGLLLAKQLVEKNKKFENEREIKENLYIQMIKVKKL